MRIIPAIPSADYNNSLVTIPVISSVNYFHNSLCLVPIPEVPSLPPHSALSSLFLLVSAAQVSYGAGEWTDGTIVVLCWFPTTHQKASLKNNHQSWIFTSHVVTVTVPSSYYYNWKEFLNLNYSKIFEQAIADQNKSWTLTHRNVFEQTEKMQLLNMSPSLLYCTVWIILTRDGVHGSWYLCPVTSRYSTLTDTSSHQYLSSTRHSIHYLIADT